jgi:hypothetical protein
LYDGQTEEDRRANEDREDGKEAIEKIGVRFWEKAGAKIGNAGMKAGIAKKPKFSLRLILENKVRPARLERATFWFVARSGNLAPIDIWRQPPTFSTSCSHRPLRRYTPK